MTMQKRYSTEFKLQAARLVVEHGYTAQKAADQLGSSKAAVQSWVKKFQQSGELATPGSESPAEVLKKIRRENAELRMENEILKKAAAYFAKESL